MPTVEMRDTDPNTPITTPFLTEILAVEPYRIHARWSNGEIRLNDYANEIEQWRTSEDTFYQQLADWNTFRTVRIGESGVFQWPTVTITFTIGSKTRTEPIEFDRITAYHQSQLVETDLANGVSLGELIRKTRLTVAISQADLARRIGTTKQYVSKVERNVVPPKADTLQRIAFAMGKRVTLI